MNIAFFIFGKLSDNYGGGQVYIINLLNGFEAERISICVLAFSENAQDEVSLYGIHHVFQIGGTRESWQEKTSRILREFSPDVAHIHGVKDFALEICQRLNIPMVITCHHGGVICPAGTMLNWKDQICDVPVSDKNCLRCVCRTLPMGWLCWMFLRMIPLQWRFKLAGFFAGHRFVFFFTPLFHATRSIADKISFINDLKKADRIICPCQRMADILSYNGINNNILVLPHGIHNVERVPLPSLNGRIHFVFIGRICYVKGIHVLLKAFQKIDSEKYVLHIIGGAANKYERKYEKRMRRLSNGLNVVWHGKMSHEETVGFLRECHVMIHPAIFLEMYGLTIAEALGCGRPVLASRCGGAEMQVEDGVNGWLIPPNDIFALHQKIIEIIHNPEVIKEYAQSCHIPMMKKHINDLLQTYQSIVEKK